METEVVELEETEVDDEGATVDVEVDVVDEARELELEVESEEDDEAKELELELASEEEEALDELTLTELELEDTEVAADVAVVEVVLLLVPK